MVNIPKPHTLVYSKIEDLEIKLDLYLPPNAAGALPAIIFFHGGGLTVGDRHDGTMSTMWLLGSFTLVYSFRAQNLPNYFRDGNSTWDDFHLSRLSSALSKHRL